MLDDAEIKVENAEEDAESYRLESIKSKAVSGFSNSQKLITMLEGVEDESAIERIVKQSGRHSMMDSELEGVRRRVRRGVVNDASPSEPLNEDVKDSFSGYGYNWAEIKQLAGM